jgi:DNA invertase Pin-like site-specific DNA recombinase
MAGKKALGYIRVSTSTQVENGAGLDVQREAIERFCKQQRWQLRRVIDDAALSGEIEDRRGLVEIEEALRGGEAEAVVIHRFDRLARDLVVQELTIARWTALGATVVSVLEGEAADDPSRKLVRQIMGAVAAYDKAMIVARLRWGREAKAKRGGFAGGGIALGYDLVGGTLVVNEEQARAVKRAAALRREGFGYRTIAARLEAEGYPTKRGGRWQSNTVRRLLHSAQVRGQISYGKCARGEHKALIPGVR